MHELAVAAKFEYARNRWLDEVADHPDAVPGLSSTHRVNDALLTLIHSRYSRVLDGAVAGAFFCVLSNLYAGHGLSLALDSTRYRNPASSITLEEYAEHARTRHGPVRAAVDAVLLSVGLQTVYSNVRDHPGTTVPWASSSTATPSTSKKISVTVT